MISFIDIDSGITDTLVMNRIIFQQNRFNQLFESGIFEKQMVDGIQLYKYDKQFYDLDYSYQLNNLNHGKQFKTTIQNLYFIFVITMVLISSAIFSFAIEIIFKLCSNLLNKLCE